MSRAYFQALNEGCKGFYVKGDFRDEELAWDSVLQGLDVTNIN